MTFRINDGPLAGREGKKVTSRQIRDRLFREAEGNVAIKVTDSNETEAFEVAGRGELQLGVLIEQMRREGFELTIGRPRVLTRANPETGAREEPMEEVLVDVDEPYAGVVVEKLARRKGELRDMRPSGGGKLRLTFVIPSRGLIGYHGEFLTDTRGTGIMNRLFAGYGPWKGPIEGRRNGTLISTEDGEAVHYALFYIQERGTLFVNPGEKVYVGMILGENARGTDLEVNPIKEKKLTNIRAAGKDDAMLLIPPRRMSLEQAIAYIEDDELVEVTPGAIRLRKRYLDPHERKRASAGRKQQWPRSPSPAQRGRVGEGVSRLPPQMLQQQHRPRHFAALRLQHLRPAHSINRDRRQQVAQPCRRVDVERQHAPTGPACQIQEHLGIAPRIPVRGVVQHDQLDALQPHRIGQLPAAHRRLLEHVADIGDHPHARIGQSTRQDRQQPRHPGQAANTGGTIAQPVGIGGELGERVQHRPAMHRQRHIELTRQRLHQRVGHRARRRPRRLPRRRGVKPEDQTRPGRRSGWNL